MPSYYVSVNEVGYSGPSIAGASVHNIGDSTGNTHLVNAESEEQAVLQAWRNGFFDVVESDGTQQEPVVSVELSELDPETDQRYYVEVSASHDGVYGGTRKQAVEAATKQFLDTLSDNFSVWVDTPEERKQHGEEMGAAADSIAKYIERREAEGGAG